MHMKVEPRRRLILNQFIACRVHIELLYVSLNVCKKTQSQTRCCKATLTFSKHLRLLSTCFSGRSFCTEVAVVFRMSDFHSFAQLWYTCSNRKLFGRVANRNRTYRVVQIKRHHFSFFSHFLLVTNE